MGKIEKQKKVAHSKKVGKIDPTSVYQDDIVKIVKIAIIVLVIFGLVYFFTGLATGKIKFGKKSQTEEKTTIQYEQILAGESFNQKSEDYLVLYYDFTADDAGLYETYLSNYKAKSGALKYYTVNMANGMNQVFKATEGSNSHPMDASQLKINGVTLIRYTNHTVSSYLEGNEAISAYFTNFGK